MPFTLAHPAAALPLRRQLGRLGCASALAIGAMAPDLPHFLPLGVSAAASHSLPGLCWFCAPAGFLAWLGYEHLALPLLVALAPRTLQHRLTVAPHPEMSSARLLAAGVSVLVGAFTHIAWDSFTHGSGLVVRAFPALRQPAVRIEGYPLPIFALLQHGSTVLGLAVLVWLARRWYRQARPLPSATWKPVAPAVRTVTLAALALPTAIAGSLVLWSYLSRSPASFAVVQRAIVRSVMSAGGVFLVSLAAAALAWRLWRLPRVEEAGGQRTDGMHTPQGKAPLRRPALDPSADRFA